MNDPDKLRAIADYLDAIPGGSEMQADLRRIADDMDAEEPPGWVHLEVPGAWVRVDDVEGINDRIVMLASGFCIEHELDQDELGELVGLVCR